MLLCVSQYRVIMKKCSKCSVIKDLSEFELRKDTGKYRGICRDCRRKQKSDKYYANLEKEREIRKEYYRNNKEVAKARVKQWKIDNPDRVAINRRKEKENNKERYYSDPEYNKKVKDNVKKWRAKNPEKVAEYKRKDKSKLTTRLSDNLRARLRQAIRHNFKKGSAVRDLGCSIDEFKTYLEDKFKPGMSWDNYGKDGWHIDHIKPLSWFDLSDPSQLREACHYTNLQPLWAKDNLKKGARTDII